jgi:hypothetical protein
MRVLVHSLIRIQPAVTLAASWNGDESDRVPWLCPYNAMN